NRERLQECHLGGVGQRPRAVVGVRRRVGRDAARDDEWRGGPGGVRPADRYDAATGGRGESDRGEGRGRAGGDREPGGRRSGAEAEWHQQAGEVAADLADLESGVPAGPATGEVVVDASGGALAEPVATVLSDPREHPGALS